MAADASKLSYFSLPGEVRNKIMDLVLVHGDIHPYKPVPKVPVKVSTPEPDSAANVYTLKPDSAAIVKPQPGIQLIATCKQAYDEGHVLFYSSNVFHLPPTMTFEWSNRLQAKHKAMIKRISITFGLEELTPAMVDEIDRSPLSLKPEDDSDFCIDEVFATLGRGWMKKLDHIADWTSLEEIEVCSFNHTHTLQYHDVVSNLYTYYLWSWRWWKRNPYWDDVLEWPQERVSNRMKALIKGVGRKETVEWLKSEGRWL